MKYNDGLFIVINEEVMTTVQMIPQDNIIPMDLSRSSASTPKFVNGSKYILYLILYIALKYK